VDALNDGFYAAFGAVEPSGKRVMITTDTSGSMGWTIPGYPMTAAETVGAMAMVTARTEPVYSLHGFNSQIYDLPVSPRMRIDTVVKKMFDSYGGSTDCAAPMLWAQASKVPVDTFQIYTDNETWAGMVHPWEALENYRQSSGIDARLQVVSIAATTRTIADPADPRQIDISGFDASVAKLLADHGRGDL
jgi:60 kDa SS-A/Ro ribonucleoprotein